MIRQLEKIVEQATIDRIYIYPYGSVAMQIEEILVKRYGFNDIIRVDNKLSKFNTNIMSLNKLQGHKWKENEVVLIASNSEKFYRDIRLMIKKYVPEENICDLFPYNSWKNNSDPRIASLAIVADEIYRKNISGAVAEAGVYKGDFAQHINVLFPDRKLYLFDSFEGFNKDDVKKDFDNYTEIYQKRLKEYANNLRL